jgi:hypothetical protein
MDKEVIVALTKQAFMLQLKWTEAMHRLHATHARAKNYMVHWLEIDKWLTLASPWHHIYGTHRLAAHLLWASPHEVHLDLLLLNYNTITSLTIVIAWVVTYEMRACWWLKGPSYTYVKHWLGLIRQSNLATLCCLPVKFPHHPSIHPPTHPEHH